MTDQEFQTLEMLLRKFRDDESVDRDEWGKRESLRFDVEFECEVRGVPVLPNRGMNDMRDANQHATKQKATEPGADVSGCKPKGGES